METLLAGAGRSSEDGSRRSQDEGTRQGVRMVLEETRVKRWKDSWIRKKFFVTLVKFVQEESIRKKPLFFLFQN